MHRLSRFDTCFSVYSGSLIQNQLKLKTQKSNQSKNILWWIRPEKGVLRVLIKKLTTWCFVNNARKHTTFMKYESCNYVYGKMPGDLGKPRTCLQWGTLVWERLLYSVTGSCDPGIAAWLLNLKLFALSLVQRSCLSADNVCRIYDSARCKIYIFFNLTKSFVTPSLKLHLRTALTF